MTMAELIPLQTLGRNPLGRRVRATLFDAAEAEIGRALGVSRSMAHLSAAGGAVNPGRCRSDSARTRESVEQWAGTWTDEFAHDQGHVGAFHTGDLQDATCDAIEVVGIAGDDADGEVGGAGHAADLGDLGDVGQFVDDSVESVLVDHDRDEGCQRVAEGARFHSAFEAAQYPCAVPASQARLHRVARQAEASRKLHTRGTRVGDQLAQEPRVGGIECHGVGFATGHRTQYDSAAPLGNRHSAQVRVHRLRTPRYRGC